MGGARRCDYTMFFYLAFVTFFLMFSLIYFENEDKF
nr:MAG TPA: hypothetical protein [Caudoviricetes sp.]